MLLTSGAFAPIAKASAKTTPIVSPEDLRSPRGAQKTSEPADQLAARPSAPLGPVLGCSFHCLQHNEAGIILKMSASML
jgi:hypothetical protein